MALPFKVILCLSLALLAAGCSARPFKIAASDSAKAALPAEADAAMVLGPFDYDPRPRAVAVCYGAFYNRPKEVLAEAQMLCPNQGHIERVAEDIFWNGCPLFQPMRASYICYPGKEPPSPYR